MFLLCAAASAAPLTVADVPNPRGRDSWIADVADVLPADAEARINGRVDALQAELGAEIAVVTVGDVEGTPKEFAGALLNTWGVGDRTANNGVVVLLVVDQRRIEIEVGYGLESVLTDGATGALLDRAVIHRFKEGKVAQGLEDGVSALDAALRRSPEDAREGTGAPVLVEQQTTSAPIGVGPRGGSGITGGVGAEGILAGVAGGGAVLLGMAGWFVYERRRRQCPTCKREMIELDEVREDAHLQPGQLSEERLGSVNYEVRTCEEHDVVVVIPHTRWFSGYSGCSRCGHRTATKRHNTLVHATYNHGGTVEVVEDCKHCGYHGRSTYSTPRKQRPSNTNRSGGSGFGGGGGGGRSGGSSFGGGRSGGGGAGRSW